MNKPRRKNQPLNVFKKVQSVTYSQIRKPTKAAECASFCILSKSCCAIASLSNIASDKTTADAPRKMYSPIESTSNMRESHSHWIVMPMAIT